MDQQPTLKSRLSVLNDPRTTDYTMEIRKVIFNDRQSHIPDDYIAIIEDEKNSKLLRFTAYYALFTQYRRFEQRFFLFGLVEKYTGLFPEDEYKYLCEIVRSQFYKFKFLDTASKNYYKQALEHGKLAIDCYGILSDNIGCFNNYADIVLDGVGHKGIVSDKDIEDALQYVDRAIYILEQEQKKTPYSQYYFRKSKLLLCQKKYDEAKRNIALAISYAKPDDKASLIKIANYHNTQLEIKTEEALDIVDTNVEDSLKKYKDIQVQMEQQQVRYIEVLGFFASTIALITGSVSITMNFSDFNVASGLIIVLSGCLILAYVSLKLLFSGEIKFYKMILMVIGALLIIALGYCIGNRFLLTWIS